MGSKRKQRCKAKEPSRPLEPAQWRLRLDWHSLVFGTKPLLDTPLGQAAYWAQIFGVLLWVLGFPLDSRDVFLAGCGLLGFCWLTTGLVILPHEQFRVRRFSWALTLGSVFLVAGVAWMAFILWDAYGTSP